MGGEEIPAESLWWKQMVPSALQRSIPDQAEYLIWGTDAPILIMYHQQKIFYCQYWTFFRDQKFYQLIEKLIGKWINKDNDR